MVGSAACGVPALLFAAPALVLVLVFAGALEAAGDALEPGATLVVDGAAATFVVGAANSGTTVSAGGVFEEAALGVLGAGSATDASAVSLRFHKSSALPSSRPSSASATISAVRDFLGSVEAPKLVVVPAPGRDDAATAALGAIARPAAPSTREMRSAERCAAA